MRLGRGTPATPTAFIAPALPTITWTLNSTIAQLSLNYRIDLGLLYPIGIELIHRIVIQLIYPDHAYQLYYPSGVHRLSRRRNGRGAAPQGTLSVQRAQGQDVWQVLYEDQAQLLARAGVSGTAGLF